jgi:GH15 family glucan-1,4-alpha-glucosidase
MPRMLRVAIDRGLRLADKRSLPCPNRTVWLAARDNLYEEIMDKAWNKEHKFFGQSYEDNDVLDSAVLIMPLVFFMHAVRSTSSPLPCSLLTVSDFDCNITRILV